MYKLVLSMLLTPNKNFRKLRPRLAYISHSFHLFFIYIFFIFGYFGQLEYSRAAKKCTHAKKNIDEYAEPPPMHCTGKQDAIFTTVFAYAKREFWNEWGVEAVLPSLLQSIRCKEKAVDRWLADLHVTLLSV